MSEPLIVVTYDVSDVRRRLHLSKALQDFGEWVQYSVFECHLDDRQLDRLRGRVTGLIDNSEDMYGSTGQLSEKT